MNENESPSISPSRILEELQRLPLAEELGKTRLARVAEVATLEEHEAGTILFRRGDPADNPRIILSGLKCPPRNPPPLPTGRTETGLAPGCPRLLPRIRTR